MRPPRAFQTSRGGISYFHVISRVAGRELIFGEQEKEQFRKLLDKQLEFSGLRALAWCFMGNHFHLLLEVPDKETALEGWTEEDLLDRLRILGDETSTKLLLSQVEMFQGNGNKEGVADIVEGVRRRLFDLSAFMKELKQRFTGWINRHHRRVGTLWEGRFKSVLIESGEALRMVAAYIDLNPVRAGLVEDPKDYRWCSYAAAVAGEREAQRGLATVMGKGARAHWRTVSRDYRMWLFGTGEERGDSSVTPEAAGNRVSKRKRGFSRQEVEAVLKAGGKLPLPAVLRCRVRYFTDGVVLGSSVFIEDFFEKRRAFFGPRRKTGARRMRGADWGGVRTLRDLKVDVIGTRD